MISRLRDMLRTLLFRRRFEADMSEEFRFHLDQVTEDLVRKGLPRAEAERRARASFGAVEGAKDEARFALVSVLTLALGIGANTTIFSVINGVLLKPLPFPESHRLVHIGMDYPLGALSIYRTQAASYDGVATYLAQGEVNLFTSGRPERVLGRSVSSEFFSVLGVSTALGRTFRSGEDAPGAAPVALISYGLWARRFGSDPAIIGKPIIVNGNTRAIVGVSASSGAPWTPATSVG